MYGQTMGLLVNTDNAVDGLTLFSNNEVSYLIDNCGKVVQTWESKYKSGGGIELLPNGNLLRAGDTPGLFNAGGRSGIFELFNWEGDLIWQYEIANDMMHAHHDIEVLPNGNFLCSVWELKTESEAQQKGRLAKGNFWNEIILELQIQEDNSVNIIWEWSLWNHLIQDVDSSKNCYGNIAENPQLIDINAVSTSGAVASDFMHINSIDYNQDLDQILFSSRHLNEIFIIDHSTTTSEAATSEGGMYGKGGDLLFRYGNPKNYNAGSTEDQNLFAQHDARWTSFDGEQVITVFNNNYDIGKASAIVVFRNPNDELGHYTFDDVNGYENVEIVTNLVLDSYSSILSSCQVLEDDHLLITVGKGGEIIEVDTKDDELVWKYINPVNRNGGPGVQGGTPRFNDLFRARRYTRDYEAFNGLELKGGDRVEFSTLEDTCMVNLSTNIHDSPLLISSVISDVRFLPFDRIEFFNNSSVSGVLTIYNLQGQKIEALEFGLGKQLLRTRFLRSGCFVFVFQLGVQNLPNFAFKKCY